MYRMIQQLLTDGEKKRFCWILFLMLVFAFFESAGFSLIIPYIALLRHPDWAVKWIEELFAITITPKDLLVCCSLFFLFVISIKSLLQIYVSRESSRFPYEFYQEKSNQSYRLYLSQPYLEHIKQSSSTNLKNCTHTIDQASVSLLIYLRYLSSLISTIFLFGLILFENFWISSGFILLFSFAGIVIYRISKKPQLDSGKEKESLLIKLFQWTSDSFSVFKEAKLYKKRPLFFSIFDQYTKRLSKAYSDSAFYPMLPPIYLEYVAVTLLLIIVGIYVHYDYPVIDLIAPLLFYGAVGRRLLPCLIQTVSQKIQMTHYLPALQTLEEELKKSNPTENAYSKEQSFISLFECRDLHFFYNSDREVLKGIDLEVKKNQSIAIVGPSGSGKSTLVKILLGLLSPSKGTFLIDGTPSHSLETIHHLIGYVPQEIALMSGTIADNITLFEKEVDQQSLQKALAMAQLDSLVNSLPEGIHTLVGERGINFSGGQRQRIGIARALYHEPSILLFDEATSSLDTLSETLMTETILSLSGKKTIIAIAHRLSSIQFFDQIYVLDQGKIVAKGNHQDLLKSCELYQNLFSSSN